ncbi:hypothetical protein EYR40_001673 [Pleurotus pulmonarius]|nr:hypothetical protein EYR40_001673 [Pleurotus pulmonarius]
MAQAENVGPAEGTDPTLNQKKKKRGNQGDFHGQRLVFLESRLSAYQRASQEGKTRTWFSNVLIPEYWEKFDWRLPLDQDPPTTGSLSTTDEALSSEDLEQKSKAMKGINTKLKTWYNNRRGALKLNSNKDPWGPWLAQLRKPMDGPPRCPHDFQFYMRHPDFKANVSGEFEKEWAKLAEKDQDEGKKMDFRCKVSQQLLALEKDEVKARLEEERAQRHKEAMDRYKKGISMEDVEDNEAREDAIATFSTVVQPLLDGLRAHTGMYIQLTAALPSANVSAIKCIYLGAGRSSDGRNFSTQDPPGFKAFTKLFLRWTMVAKGLLPESTLNRNESLDIENPNNGANHHPMPGALPPTNGCIAPAGPIVHAAQTQPTNTTDTQYPSPKHGKTQVPTVERAIPFTARPSPPTPSIPNSPAASAGPCGGSRGKNPGTGQDSREEKANRLLEKAVESVREALKESRLAPELEPSIHLLRSIAKLAPDARRVRINDLSRMGEYEFQRENNIANNMNLLASLGLKNPTAMFNRVEKDDEQGGELDEDDYRPTREEKSLEGAQRRSTRFMKGTDPEGNGVTETSSDVCGRNPICTDEEEGQEERRPEGAPRRSTRCKKGSDQASKTYEGADDKVSAGQGEGEPEPTKGNQMERAPVGQSNNTGGEKDGGKGRNPPKWFPEAVKAFQKANPMDFGDKWFDLVERWRAWEEENNHGPHGEDLPKENRPPQLATWIKSARYFHRVPDIGEPSEFMDRWWAWWTSCNPSWRVSTTSKQLLRGVDGPWGAVTATGNNGLVSIVTSLWWAHKVTPESNPAIERWHEAIDDVLWVLEHGCQSDGVEDGTDGTEEQLREPPRKRMRMA